MMYNCKLQVGVAHLSLRIVMTAGLQFLQGEVGIPIRFVVDLRKSYGSRR